MCFQFNKEILISKLDKFNFPQKIGLRLSNGGIHLGINYSVSNETKRDK
jgi:hypothetical protein